MSSFEAWRRLRRSQSVRPRYQRRGSGLDMRKKLLILVLGLVMALAAVSGVGLLAYKGLGQSDFFVVTGIRIEGCRRTTKKQVLAMSGIDVHTNLLGLDIGRVRERIESHEWIEQADIARDWPNRLIITIKERSPVALVSLEGSLYYLDRRGVAFAPALPPEDIDFPVITGLAGRAAAGHIGEKADAALQFIHYASRGNPMLPKQNLSEIHVEADGSMTLFLADKPFPIRLGKEKMGTKYYRLVRVLHWLYKRKKFETTAYIDMDYLPDKVLVGMAGTA